MTKIFNLESSDIGGDYFGGTDNNKRFILRTCWNAHMKIVKVILNSKQFLFIDFLANQVTTPN